jgi:DNA-binding transcriptional ArsR family regulator
MDNNSAIAVLGALAQTTRLETFRLLVRHEPDGIPAGELARLIDVPQNTMSAHLATRCRGQAWSRASGRAGRSFTAPISTACVN